jgi:hypothetical protein
MFLLHYTYYHPDVAQRLRAQSLPLNEYSHHSSDMAVTETAAVVPERRVRPQLVFEASHQRLGAEDPDSTPFWGWVLLIATYIMFVSGMYSVFISKWMPDTGSVVSIE